MSNHNKIRPVDKNNLDGKYKILFSSPQSKNSKIPLKFRGLQYRYYYFFLFFNFFEGFDLKYFKA